MSYDYRQFDLLGGKISESSRISPIWTKCQIIMSCEHTEVRELDCVGTRPAIDVLRHGPVRNTQEVHRQQRQHRADQYHPDSQTSGLRHLPVIMATD